MMRGMGSLYKRGNVWWVAYYVNGALKRESTQSTKESMARKLLKQRLGEVTSGAFIEPKERRVTVEELLDTLEADYQLREGRAYKQFQAHLKPNREALGHFRALDITAARIDRYVKHRLMEGKRPATVNRETQLLGQAFKLAQEHGLVQRVPASDVCLNGIHVRDSLRRRSLRQWLNISTRISKILSDLPTSLAGERVKSHNCNGQTLIGRLTLSD